MLAEIDTRDEAILAQRLAAWDERPEPRCGDYVRFADGIERRISHVWFDEHIQTSDSGSWYLGSDYMSFSGRLYRSVPADTLTLLDEVKTGSCWIFHHDQHCAHNGVDFKVPCRVYACSVNAPN